MPTRTRARLVALSAAVALTAFLVGAGASSASANVPEHLKLAWGNGGVDTLTLPSSDEFDDGVVLDITSNQPGTADLTFKRLSGSGGSVFAGSTSYVLGGSGTTWTGTPSFEDNDVTVGSWQITVKVNGATEKTVVKIGSGVAKTVKATVQLAPVFENSGVAAHALYPHIVARDELGTSLPILQGTATFTDAKGKNPVTRTFESSTPSTPGVTLTAVNGLNIEGTNPGVGTLKVTGIQGPSSSSKSPSSTSHPKISVAKLTSLSVTTGYTTLYPDATGTPAPDAIRVDAKNNTGVALPLAAGSFISIVKGSLTADSWAATESGVTNESWDGRDGSSVVPGTYTVFVTIALQNGNTLKKTAHLVVSSAVPVQRTVSVTYKGSDLAGRYLDSGKAKCKAEGSALHCVSASGQTREVYISHTDPKAVLALAKPLGYTVTLSFQIANFLSNGGNADFHWGDGTHPLAASPITGNGTITSGPFSAANTATKSQVLYDFGNAISFDLKSYTYTYEYWALK